MLKLRGELDAISQVGRAGWEGVGACAQMEGGLSNRLQGGRASVHRIRAHVPSSAQLSSAQLRHTHSATLTTFHLPPTWLPLHARQAEEQAREQAQQSLKNLQSEYATAKARLSEIQAAKPRTVKKASSPAPPAPAAAAAPAAPVAEEEPAAEAADGADPVVAEAAEAKSEAPKPKRGRKKKAAAPAAAPVAAKQ